MLAADDVVVCGNAAACMVPLQTAQLLKGQRLISIRAPLRWGTTCISGAAVAGTGSK